MRPSNNGVLIGATIAICVLVALPVTQVWAGGPPCRAPQCMPPMCAPPMPCPPPVCAPPMPCPPPICAAPMPCPPPVCAPPRPCGPPACGPRPCKENPLKRMFTGACDLVAGAISLPFAALDCLLNPEPCGPRGGPCKVAAGPCPPPVCMPPMCGPGYGPAYGMGRRHMGPGRSAHRKMVPFAEKKSARTQLFAGPVGGLFGNYW
jgi:hypothetical protein